MIRWQFQSKDSGFAKQLAGKSLIAGLFLIGLGMLIIAVPQLVVIPLAILFFIGGFFCLASAWRLFLVGKVTPKKSGDKEYEDANYREIS